MCDGVRRVCDGCEMSVLDGCESFVKEKKKFVFVIEKRYFLNCTLSSCLIMVIGFKKKA